MKAARQRTKHKKTPIKTHSKTKKMSSNPFHRHKKLTPTKTHSKKRQTTPTKTHSKPKKKWYQKKSKLTPTKTNSKIQTAPSYLYRTGKLKKTRIVFADSLQTFKLKKIVSNSNNTYFRFIFKIRGMGKSFTTESIHHTMINLIPAMSQKNNMPRYTVYFVHTDIEGKSLLPKNETDKLHLENTRLTQENNSLKHQLRNVIPIHNVAASQALISSSKTDDVMAMEPELLDRREQRRAELEQSKYQADNLLKLEKTRQQPPPIINVNQEEKKKRLLKRR